MAADVNASNSEARDKLRVLVIDDEKNIRTTLTLCLEQFGCEVTGAGTAESALHLLSQQVFDRAFLHLRLGDSHGLDLIPGGHKVSGIAY